MHASTVMSSCTFDDWHVVPDTVCKGYYLPEPLPHPELSEKALKALPTTVTADQGLFTQEGNSTLNGHVHLIQGNAQLFSDHAIIHRDPNKKTAIDLVKAIGDVKITEPGLRVDGVEAELYTETDTKIIEKADYRLYDRHGRGNANRITIYGKTKMVLKSATYTTCSPFQNTWSLKARNLDLNKKTGRGRARHARLYVYKVPIFYTPYIDFPIDDRRQTGFLFPLIGTTNNSGFEFSAPFYWNIAPNYDATITPRYFTLRGLEMAGQYRYLSAHSTGSLEGAILPNDRAYKQFQAQSLANHPLMANNDPRVTALNTNDTRKAFRLKNVTNFNEQWSSNIQYHWAGDDNYFMDFGNNIGIASNTQLLQQADVTYQDRYWNMKTLVQQYQTLHPFSGPVTSNVYKILPQIDAKSDHPDLPYGFTFTTQESFTHFAHKIDPFTGSAFTVGNRYYFRPGISRPFIAPGWFLKPRIQWDFLADNVSLSPTQITQYRTTPSRAIPIVDFDTGLIFERNLKIAQEPYLQTLEPRAYYLYVPYRNQNSFPVFDTSYPGFDINQLYRDNRFSGFDRLGDANQVTLGLTNRFLTEKTGRERLNLTIGQIFYFHERLVTICNPNLNPLCALQESPTRTKRRSDLVGLANCSLTESWTASANIDWDPYQKNTDKEFYSIHYQPDERLVVNVGYQFLRRNPAENNPITGLPLPLRQADSSIAFPVAENWRVLGRWFYDIHNRRTNNVSFGIEQEGCCTAVRLFVTRFILPFDPSQPTSQRQFKRAIYLQFIFKGFAGVGHRTIDGAIRQGIPGYQ